MRSESSSACPYLAANSTTMSVYIVISLCAFIGMAVLVIQNARRIAHGNVELLRPMSIRDLVRPSIDTAKSCVLNAWTGIREACLTWGHALSYSVGKKFIDLAWMVKGKRQLNDYDEGAISKIWREVANERDRLRAHFEKQPTLVE